MAIWVLVCVIFFSCRGQHDNDFVSSDLLLQHANEMGRFVLPVGIRVVVLFVWRQGAGTKWFAESGRWREMRIISASFGCYLSRGGQHKWLAQLGSKSTSITYAK